MVSARSPRYKVVNFETKGWGARDKVVQLPLPNL